MKLTDQFSTMKKHAISESIIKKMIEEARLATDSSRLSDLETIEEIIYATKNFYILANTLYDGIHIVDPDGIIDYINEGFTRITGLTSEIIGKSIKDIEELGYNSQIASEALVTLEPVNINHCSPITKVCVTTTATPVFDQGNLLGIIIIDRDISELERLQDALAKSQRHLKIMKEELIFKEKALAKLTEVREERLLVGESSALKKVKELIQQIAPLDATVLITGETGSGKENVANEIHKNSIRRNKPFIKVNCSAIPVNLIESELFGYEKGAFTGANASGKIGYFEMAQNGTILLDEIGELPLELQPKLLRVIQHKELLRIGSSKPIELDVRIIAATNRNLYKMCTEGTFRMDLYYRLNLFPIDVPSLRQRIEDIPLLTNYYLAFYNSKYGKNAAIEQNAFNLLTDYTWPGNIRELQNIIERMVIISQDSVEISEEQISSALGIFPLNHQDSEKGMRLQDKIEALEKSELMKALEGGRSMREAAKTLGINASNVVRKMQKYGIRQEK